MKRLLFIHLLTLVALTPNAQTSKDKIDLNERLCTLTNL